MSVIRATDYIESLQKCCEITEKFYEQAQNDLVAAERKRDEAKAIMDEAFSRLKEAKKKIDTNSLDVSPVISSTKKVSKRTVHVKGKHRSLSATRERKVEGDKTSSKDPTTNDSIEKQTGKELESNGSPRLKRSSSLDARRKKSIKAKSDLERPSSHRGTFNSTGSPKRKILTPEQRKKKLMARENPSVRNLNIIDLPNSGTPVLEICKGRSSEWYESNIDCATFGLVKRFYQAALGTKTSSATNKVFISSILLDDEWNDLIGNTSQVQELYIGTSSSSSDGKETLRDRAARALVQPPQKEPIALFFAPRNKLDTDKVYYGGHWKVIAGHMLEPPQTVKGQPRQCLVKFVFSGIESNLVKAINDGN